MMCLAIPAQIQSISVNYAYVTVMGIEKEVNIQIIEQPKVGDYVLIHAGCAIQKIDTCYFNFLQEVLTSMMEEQQGGE